MLEVYCLAEELDDFFLLFVCHCLYSCFVAAAGLDEDVDVFFVFEPGYAGCCPGVVFSVDEYHRGVVVGQVGCYFAAEGWVEGHVAEFGGEHVFVEVAFGGFDFEVVFEGGGVVAVVAEFAGCLYEE